MSDQTTKRRETKMPTAPNRTHKLGTLLVLPIALILLSSALMARMQVARADQRGSQISDNLGLIVIGVVAIVAIGAAITGLGTAVISYVTKELGLG
jgi:hypothetical protein